MTLQVDRRFNKRSLTDERQVPFPDARLLETSRKGVLEILAMRKPGDIVNEIVEVAANQ